MTCEKDEMAENASSDDAEPLHDQTERDKAKKKVMAELGVAATAGNVATSQHFLKPTFGTLELTASFEAVMAQVSRVEAGDLCDQRAMLVAQSVTLNAIFNEMARRSAANMNDYVETSERFMRMALKAQAQSRANIEALDRMVNGHEQTVRHIHLDNRGGQAIIAEKIDATGGQENNRSTNQPHAQGTLRTALPCTNTLGDGVQIPRRKRKTAMPDARRD